MPARGAAQRRRLWRFNAGTPATLVAEWAGHTVEVLYRIYAHCLDGDDERWFERMEQALG